MKEKPVAIEDNAGNILFFADPRQRQPNLLRSLYPFDILDLGHQVFRERRYRCQCYPAVVGNDLRVDVLIALENRNPRALIRPHNLFANPLFSPRAGNVSLLICHLFFLTLALRASCRADRFSGFAPDDFFPIFDALAFVWLRRSEAT